jgi:hypothetical protein
VYERKALLNLIGKYHRNIRKIPIDNRIVLAILRTLKENFSVNIISQ